MRAFLRTLALVLACVAGATAAHAAFATVAVDRIPRADIPLSPGAPSVYGPSSLFSGGIHYDQLHLSLPPGAAPEQIERAAHVLSPNGGLAPALEKISRAVQEGRPLPVTDLMPPAAAALTGRRAAKYGPNCFNATAIYHGLAPAVPEHLDEFTMADLLFDHFRPLGPQESMRLGDVLAVYDDAHTPMPAHTAVYVGADYFWHKASTDRPDPWTFERLHQVLDYYFRDETAPPALRLFRRLDDGPRSPQASRAAGL